MTQLKLGPITEDKPVRLTVDIPAALFEDLRTYGALLDADSPIAPVRLIVPMLARFVATDRGFAKARRSGSSPK